MSTNRAARIPFSGLVALIADHPVIFLLTCGIIFMGLGWKQDGINLDSATYATIARNMTELGHWFNPTYTQYYHPNFAEHPPLVMWIQGFLFFLLGSNDSTARIFGEFCTIGSILTVYFIGQELGGKKLGFLSGLVLLLTYNFMQIGNSTLLDVPMTFFGLLSLLGVIKIQKGNQSSLILGLTGLALAGSFLAKGVVSAPVWVASILSLIMFKRNILLSIRGLWFWVGAFGPVGLFFLMDYLYANGHFVQHYFFVQVGRRFAVEGPAIHPAWWEFSWRFITMYLPFIILLPIGIYLCFRNWIKLFGAILISLGLYWVLYSVAAKLYYHYFCPVYAFASFLAALPLVLILSDRIVKHISTIFFALWIVSAIGIVSAGIRIHQIRTPEIYSSSTTMNQWLADKSSRDGLLVGDKEPNWDYIAKTAWYWRSNVKSVQSLQDAVTTLQTDISFQYVIIPSERSISKDQENDFGLLLLESNDAINIYVRRGTLVKN